MSVRDDGEVIVAGDAVCDIADVSLAMAGTFLLNRSATVGSLTVINGGVVTHTAGQAGLDLTVTGDAVVAAGGSLSVDGRGRGAAAGVGAGQSGDYGSGAGHGGVGGASYGGLPGGPVYGSVTEPAELGSGGGNGASSSGGAGGGLVRLTVNGTLQVDGVLSASGLDGEANPSNRGGGGGSGGSIYLTVGTLAGTGTISSDGGNGAVVAQDLGGGGGGGRIAIYYGTDDFGGTLQVEGGAGYENGETGSIQTAWVGALRVLFHMPDGLVNQLVASVDVGFSGEIDPNTFTVDDIEITGPEGPVPVDPPVHLGGNAWRAGFPEQSTDGEYCLAIGPHVEDLDSNEMDQDGDGTPGEDPADVYIGCFTIDMTPPEIIDQAPLGDMNLPVDHVVVTFSEEINPSTFTADDVDLTGPAGPIGSISVSESGDPGSDVWSITFPQQSDEGLYSLSVGPAIEDLAGNDMDAAYDGGFTINLPDLAASNPTAPGEAYVGEQIAVGWTVTNTGAGPTDGNWFDCVYLSDDDQPGNDTELACLARPNDLSPSGWYDQITQITLPGVAEGDYWIIVQADEADDVYEADEGNNAVVVGPISICRPDLEPSNPIAPPVACTGESVSVDWTVTNTSLCMAAGMWQDCLFLSADDQPGGDTLLACVSRPSELDGGQWYDQSTVVTIPGVVEGDYWIIVAADEGDALLESDEADNAVATGLITISRPDLAVSNPAAPPTACTGGQIAVDWTVSNPSQCPTVGTWQDCVYLSTDDQPGADTQLTCIPRPNGLNGGEWYDQSTVVTIPGVVEGDYWFVIIADAANGLAEAGEANNTIVVGPIAVSRPNLSVGNGTAPGSGGAGGDIEVGWTVTNSTICRAEGSWQDCVYLSDDDQAGGDTQLGCVMRANGLDAGAFYDQVSFVTVPAATEGTYWIVIKADITGVLPETSESDNAIVVGAIDISRPDLEVSNPAAPPTGHTGGRIDVSWTVTNIASADAIGTWQDCVYLSVDNQIGNDTLLSCEPWVDQLDTGTWYDQMTSVTLPGVESGEYWVVILTDDGDALPESSEANNAVITDPIVISRPNLTIGAELVMPLEGWTERQIVVGWNVMNSGGVPAEGSWQDCIYLSDDNVIGNDDLLNCMGNPVDLDIGEHYDRVGPAEIPVVAGGDYWIVVKTNDGCAFAESDDCADNEIIDGPFPVSVTPCSDLAPSGVFMQAEAVAGGEAGVDWVVTNIGSGPTDTPFWFDRVYLSVDQLPGGDHEVGAFQNPMALNATPPDNSYSQSPQIAVPDNLYGDYYVIVQADGNGNLAECREDNNFAVSATTMFVDQVETPTLTAANAEVSPESPWPEDPINVTWTLTNFGNVPTGYFEAEHTIILSVDDSLQTTGDNRTLAAQVGLYAGDLGSGETSVLINASAVLPSDVWGANHILVVPTIALGAGLNTWPGSTPINIVMPPIANLVVDSMSADASGISGEPINVSWTVRNSANNATFTDTWVDAVILSQDNSLDTIEDNVQIGAYTHVGVLGFKDTYDATLGVTLPNDADGPYYIFVCTDALNQVFEGDTGGENDNCTSPTPITVVYMAPDLQVQDVLLLADSPVLSGTAVAIHWTVLNSGDRATGALNWFDRIYLSADNVLDAGDRTLTSVWQSGPLGPGESYLAERTVSIPLDFVAPAAYIFVCTDVNDHVYESDDDNNCEPTRDPFEVVWGPSDLEVTSVSVLANGELAAVVSSGSTVTVEWTIFNSGPGATSVGSWNDRIYLSDDGTLGGDHVLASPPHSGTLAAGEQYLATASVTVPIWFTGSEVYIFVKTDWDNRVTESNEGNNAGAGDPFEVLWGPPDLTITVLSAVHGTPHGEVVDVSWTVQNVGGPTVATQWNDKVYLSADRWFSPDDVELDTPGGPLGPHIGELDHGQTYSRAESVAIPPDSHGYIVVVTDAADPDNVEESNEDNNEDHADLPLPATECNADLVVTSVDAPDTALSGQLMNVQWTVANDGTEPTNVGSWNDALYLSPDQFLDYGEDYYLGYRGHSGVLNGGSAYDPPASFDVRVPSGLTGAYYVFVVTDSSNHVCETDNTNNVELDGIAVQIELAPPADLVVTDIVVPADGHVGQDVLIQWAVHNSGDFDAQGSWRDSVYISTDETWDIGDPKIGESQHQGPVAVDGSYTGSLEAELPGVVPAHYYIIVRTDIHDEVRESADGEQNNVTPSVGTFVVTITELTVGTPYPGTLTTGAERYFRVCVQIDETLRITLDADTVSGLNEVYVRFGEVADRGRHDFAYSNPFSPDQTVVVPTTRDGCYYVFLHAAALPAGSTDYTLLAESVPFSISRVTPTDGARTGTVTFQLEGARFERDTYFAIVDAEGVVISPEMVYPLDASKAFATFDLQNAALGSADLTAASQGFPEVVAEDALQVVDSGSGRLITRVLAPGSVRVGRGFVVQVEYANVGHSDIPAPILELLSTPALGLSVRSEGPFQTGPMRILGIDFNGPAGVLPPGQGGLIPIYVGGAEATGSVQQRLTRLSGERVVNWVVEEQRMRAPGLSDLEWQVIWTRLRDYAGNTWGGVERAVGQNATRLWLDGQMVYAVNELLVLAWESGVPADGRNGGRSDGGSGNARVSEEPPARVTAPGVQITLDSDTQFTGILNRDPVSVGFDSRMETPFRAMLRLQLGNVVLNAEADFAEATRTLDGHGHGLTVDERMALLELNAELERSLEPYGRPLPPHEDFLFRVVSYWAEAPVGHPLGHQVVSRAGSYEVHAPPDRSGPDYECSSGYEPEVLFDCQECDIPPWCGCDGEDGITIIPCGCIPAYDLRHDTFFLGHPDEHCFCAESLVTGCDLDTLCLGRCGPGCGFGGASGIGTYTLDCAEHDRCCRVHGDCWNPADSDCGDEWQEAMDDFLLGYTNCPDGCWCGNGQCDPGEDPCNCIQDCPGCCRDSECNDGNHCTDDWCVAGSCQHFNNSDVCDDGAFCNGSDTCSAGNCTHTGDPCLSGTTCNEDDDTCDSDTDPCENDPNPCCGDPDPCCDPNGPCCGSGDPCCGSMDPCCGSSDPCCYSNDPCCGSGDPCCGSSDPCCGSTDPCCNVNGPCCGSSDPCCNPNNPCCGSGDPCCGSFDPCCNPLDPCCGNPDPCCDPGNPCCGSSDPCCGIADPCCGSSDPCCNPSNPCCGSTDPCCNPADPCCGNSDSCCNPNGPCCGNPDSCCNPNSPCCGSNDSCCDASSPCCGDADSCCDPSSPCCGDPDSCCDPSSPCCGDPDSCCDPSSPCCGDPDPCCDPSNPCCGSNDPCCDPSNPCCGDPCCGAGAGNCCSGCPTVTNPVDPNEKIGPAGFGEQLSVSSQQVLPFTVYFENLPDATAWAAEVTIMDQLSSDLDWATFQLGEIAFGDLVIQVPDHRPHYYTEPELENGLIAQIDAGIDIQTGVATWALTAIDPETGEIPTDPLLGLLPPNNPDLHDGEGHVTFMIRLLPDVVTGIEITNSATIIFDVNEPIETNEVFNTIDSGEPDSSVSPLPAETPTTEFEIQWSGQDDVGGSGIESYTIYASRDEEPYWSWLTTSDTSDTFTGARGGGSYAFYSVARDNVGHTEDPPETPDARTTIAVQVPFAPGLVPTAATVTLTNLGIANDDSIEHAVFEENSELYVGENGRLTDSPFWQPLDQWPAFIVRALPPSTEHLFSTQARSASGDETAFGPTTAVSTSVLGDVDGNGVITHVDVDLVQQALGTEYGDPGFDARADLNADDRVTFADLGIVQQALPNTGDCDTDGDVDLSDFSTLHSCVEEGGPPGPDCRCADLNSDNAVNVLDFGLFQAAFTGESGGQ